TPGHGARHAGQGGRPAAAFRHRRARRAGAGRRGTGGARDGRPAAVPREGVRRDVTGANGVTLREVAPGVFVARTDPLDVNVTLVLGDATALVVDTLSTAEQARALLAAVRSVTGLPLAVVNTHFHFDHCFGNDVIAAEGGPVYGHPYTIEELGPRGTAWQ